MLFKSCKSLEKERTDGSGAERRISSANLIAFYALLLIVAFSRVAVLGIGKCSVYVMRFGSNMYVYRSGDGKIHWDESRAV